LGTLRRGGGAIDPNRPAEIEPRPEPEPVPESGPEPEVPGDEPAPLYSTPFDFQGGVHPSDDDVQRFHDQNLPLSPEDIAVAELE